VYLESEMAQVEVKSGQVSAPAADPLAAPLAAPPRGRHAAGARHAGADTRPLFSST